MQNARKLANNFPSLLAALFGCESETGLPAAAARFILGLSPDISFEDSKYPAVDALMDDAMSRFSIEVKHVKSDESSRLGRLYVKPDGFGLKIRRDIRQSSYRFVKAHELAHVLAYDRRQPEPRRYFSNSAIEEKLCDSIARHILLPKEFLYDRLRGIISTPDNFRTEHIESLSKEYLVAPWQVIRRAIEQDHDLMNSIVAILWKQEQASDTVRSIDCFSPVGLYIPLKDRSFKQGKTNQVPWKAIHAGGLISEEDNLQLGSLRGKLVSVGFPTSDPWPCVVQIVYLDALHISKLSNWRASRINIGT